MENDFLKFYKKNLDFTYSGKLSSDDEKKIQEKFLTLLKKAKERNRRNNKSCAAPITFPNWKSLLKSKFSCARMTAGFRKAALAAPYRAAKSSL